jgi:hypothetical protein
MQASAQLAPYLHSKNATKPVQPDPIFYEVAIDLPRPTNLSEAYANILKLSEMKAHGQIDVATADNLINDQRIVLNAMVDEAKLLAAQGDPNAEQRIVITGGLPPIPGCDVIMPQLNGHKTIDETGNLIPHEQANEEPKPALPGDTSLPVNPDPQSHPPEPDKP